jgi:ribosome-binding factor A
MWTHYDGYRVLEGGKLQALAGGDKRFGGTHDVVSFSPDYSSAKIFVRFAVVQKTDDGLAQVSARRNLRNE